MSEFDPRVTPAREDLAAESLRGVVSSPRYATALRRRVRTDVAPLRRRPDLLSSLDTQMLRGEAIESYHEANGWTWGQAEADGYVGYVPTEALDELGDSPTHKVAAPLALHYAKPAASSPAIDASWHGSLLRVLSEPTADGFVEAAEGGWMHVGHLAPIGQANSDPVEMALRFVGAPYLLGGRTARGLDCSALVQLAYAAAKPPRDSDMQREALGRALEDAESSRRGDLVFWDGHVGILCEPETMVHANAHHMAVAVEPLEGAVHRLAGKGLPVMARRRMEP